MTNEPFSLLTPKWKSLMHRNNPWNLHGGFYILPAMFHTCGIHAAHTELDYAVRNGPYELSYSIRLRIERLALYHTAPFHSTDQTTSSASIQDA